MPFRKQRPEVAPGIEQMHPRWERILRGESSLLAGYGIDLALSPGWDGRVFS